MRIPTMRRRRPAPAPPVTSTMASLHTCPRCHHTAFVADDLWLTITDLRGQELAKLCSPRCAVLWLEATYRPAGLGVSL